MHLRMFRLFKRACCCFSAVPLPCLAAGCRAGFSHNVFLPTRDSLLPTLQRLANNFGMFTNVVPPLLNMVDFAHRLVGPKPLEFLSRTLNKGTGNIVPTWNPYLPRVRLLGHLTLTLCRQPWICCRFTPWLSCAAFRPILCLGRAPPAEPSAAHPSP